MSSSLHKLIHRFSLFGWCKACTYLYTWLIVFLPSYAELSTVLAVYSTSPHRCRLSPPLQLLHYAHFFTQLVSSTCSASSGSKNALQRKNKIEELKGENSLKENCMQGRRAFVNRRHDCWDREWRLYEDTVSSQVDPFSLSWLVNLTMFKLSWWLWSIRHFLFYSLSL